MWIQKISVNPDFIVDNCCDQSCKLKMHGIERYVILKGEKVVGSEQKICDCIIFLDGHIPRICLVELKSRSLSVGDIIAKLKNGYASALRIYKSTRISTEPEIYLILLAKSYSNYDATARLSSEIIDRR